MYLCLPLVGICLSAFAISACGCLSVFCLAYVSLFVFLSLKCVFLYFFSCRIFVFRFLSLIYVYLSFFKVKLCLFVFS